MQGEGGPKPFQGSLPAEDSKGRITNFKLSSRPGDYYHGPDAFHCSPESVGNFKGLKNFVTLQRSESLWHYLRLPPGTEEGLIPKNKS